MKVLLFDIDGTLIRAGGAGRKALNRAAFELYGKKDACSELSLAGHTDLWNFREAYICAKGKRPTAAALERLQSCLGTLNDMRVHAGRARQVANPKRRARGQPQKAFAMRFLTGREQADQGGHRERPGALAALRGAFPPAGQRGGRPSG